MNVIFDAQEWFHHPNVGLYSFCRHLVPELAAEAQRRAGALTLYGDFYDKAALPAELRYRTRRRMEKYLLWIDRKYQVWHSSFQFNRRFPLSSQRVLLTVHDLNYLYEGESAAERRRLSEMLRRNLRRADRVVAISEFTRRDILANFDIEAEKVSVVYNGCCQSSVAPQPPETPPRRPFLFALGTVLPKKNFHVLPGLLAGNDYDLIIAGNPSPYGDVIMAEAKKFNAADRVKLAGPVTEAVKAWYYRNCSAFLFPSKVEGFGLPAIEAMRYGKPVFLSQYTALPEIGGDAAFYFDRDFTPELMQKELEQGLRAFDDGRARRAIERAEMFSWANAAREYWNIYGSMQ